MCISLIYWRCKPGLALHQIAWIKFLDRTQAVEPKTAPCCPLPQCIQHCRDAINDWSAKLRALGIFGIDVQGIAVVARGAKSVDVVSGEFHAANLGEYSCVLDL